MTGISNKISYILIRNVKRMKKNESKNFNVEMLKMPTLSPINELYILLNMIYINLKFRSL